VIRDFVLTTAFHYVFSSSCVLNGLTSLSLNHRPIARALRVMNQIMTHHTGTFVVFLMTTTCVPRVSDMISYIFWP
jgi:hypothetical protein